jgi:hypothetical protein
MPHHVPTSMIGSIIKIGTDHLIPGVDAEAISAIESSKQIKVTIINQECVVITN